MKISYYFLCCLLLIAGSCSKNDDDDDSGGSGGTTNTTINIDSPWQYTMKVDGTTDAKVENGTTVSGVWSNNTSLATWPDSTINNYNSALYNPANGSTYFEVYRNGHKYVGATAADSVFLHYFDAGSYAYSMEDFNGVSIRWMDSNGDVWATDFGTADQTGSAFVIDQVKVMTGYSDYTVKVLSHFNCKLYNGLGQSKTVTDGKYVSLFQNF